MSKWLNLFLENEIVNRSDRFRFETNMSPLSLRPQGLLDEKMVNTPEPDISDKPNRSDPNLNLSGSTQDVLRIFSPYSERDFEERLAIAEIDGNQNPIQAHRIAYLDAFISILSTLAEDDPYQDWLAQKIQTTLAILEAQNFPTLN